MMKLVPKKYDRVYCSSGDRIVEKHTLVYDDQGNKKLVAAPSFDQYAYTQSFLRECDIDLMMKRYDAGDLNALQVTPGIYGSASDLSNNFADYFSANKAMEAYFENDEKAQQIYGSDYKRFLEDFSRGAYDPSAEAEQSTHEGGGEQ